MRRNKLILLLSAFLLIGFSSSAFAATTLKKLGEHPFFTPPLTSVADLQAMVKKNAGKIEEGFKKAGAAQLYPVFMAEFPKAKIESVKIQPGEKIEWMLFRKWGKGQVSAAKDLVWGGKAPFEAFKVSFQNNGNQYNFIIPNVCGNIALQNKSALPAPPPVAQNKAPICALKLSSSQVQCGKTVTADASGSSDPDGKIASVTFTVVDSKGAKVSEIVDTEVPYVQELVIPCDADNYTVQVVVTDDKGAKSSNAGCSQTVASVKPLGGPFAAIGYMHQFDPGNYVLAKVGYDYAINEKLHALGAVGFYYQFHGYDGETSVSLDGLLNYYVAPNFALGAGVGLWSGDDGRVDLLLSAIYDLPNKLFGMKSSLFVEGRCDFEELDDPELSSRLGLGLMVHF